MAPPATVLLVVQRLQDLWLAWFPAPLLAAPLLAATVGDRFPPATPPRASVIARPRLAALAAALLVSAVRARPISPVDPQFVAERLHTRVARAR